MMKRDMTETLNQENQVLTALCKGFRERFRMRRYEDCEKAALAAMAEHPHAAQPHNLLGVLMEEKGDHLTAMRHFRAAWALDPTYLPARYNMELTGDFFSHGPCAIDEDDCPRPSREPRYKVEYDDRGVGHVVMRK